jgi:hypothetical protein
LLAQAYVRDYLGAGERLFFQFEFLAHAMRFRLARSQDQALLTELLLEACDRFL